MKQLIRDHGVFAGSRKLLNDEGDVCLEFALQYFLSQLLLIVAALSVVFINTVLKVGESGTPVTTQRFKKRSTQCKGPSGRIMDNNKAPRSHTLPDSLLCS
jgi:hypothetical protein